MNVSRSDARAAAVGRHGNVGAAGARHGIDGENSHLARVRAKGESTETRDSCGIRRFRVPLGQAGQDHPGATFCIDKLPGGHKHPSLLFLAEATADDPRQDQ